MPFRSGRWILDEALEHPPCRVALSVISVHLTCPFSDPSEVSMPETTSTDVDTTAPAADEALVEESLVEEVSIDGMCGVY
jgi:mycofactocin precursor